jgi:hypothetical protein
MPSENQIQGASCVIHNVHGSNFANLMIKFLCAQKLRMFCQDVQLSNYNMPYWGMTNLPVASEEQKTVDFLDDQRVDLLRASYLINSGQVGRINLHGHYQRMEYLPSHLESNEYFKTSAETGVVFGKEFLVCPIRGGEILDAIHPGYPLVPIDFYRDMALETGLMLVFMGQLEDNVYIKRLKAAFPQAIYLPSLGPLGDFQTIRKARNILLPVSTFAWLAAWLSSATQIILPVFGLFNPKQYPNHDLLPVFESRYKFFEFPVHHAVPLDQVDAAHLELSGKWSRKTTTDYLRV